LRLWRFRFCKLSLRDFQKPEKRLESAKQLEIIANRLSETVIDLDLLVLDFDPHVRRQAARTLQQIGPSARHAVPNLIIALEKESHDDVRTALLGAIYTTAPYSKEAIPLLIKLGRDRNPEIRRRSIGTLGAFGPLAREAVPLLLDALHDPYKADPKKAWSGISFSAYSSLMEIDQDAKAAFQGVITLRKAGQKELRNRSIEEWRKIVPTKKESRPFVIGLLRSQADQKLRPFAAYALGVMAPEAHEAVPALIGSLSTTDWEDAQTAVEFQNNVIWALGRFGAKASSAITHLRKLRATADEPLRSVLDDALRKIEMQE
jgi:HEAT repeat protein